MSDRVHHRAQQGRQRVRRALTTVALCLSALGAALVPIAGVSAAPTPVSRAAPYLYLGWGNPPDPTAIMSAPEFAPSPLLSYLPAGGARRGGTGTGPSSEVATQLPSPSSAQLVATYRRPSADGRAANWGPSARRQLHWPLPMVR